MLEYMPIHNDLVSDVFMDDKSGMKCQLNHLNFVQYIIKQKRSIN